MWRESSLLNNTSCSLCQPLLSSSYHTNTAMNEVGYFTVTLILLLAHSCLSAHKDNSSPQQFINAFLSNSTEVARRVLPRGSPPNVFIISPHKSATSSLYSFIRQRRPQTCATEKVLGYFLLDSYRSSWHLGPESYLKKFQKCQANQVTVDDTLLFPFSDETLPFYFNFLHIIFLLYIN